MKETLTPKQFIAIAVLAVATGLAVVEHSHEIQKQVEQVMQEISLK